MGLNDDAWRALFERYDIPETVRRDGRFLISANQIKAFREPRLMTKFDHRLDLPALFLENKLAILPVSRGDYIISSFKAYQTFEEPCGAAERITIPAHLQSLMPQFLVSESIALNCADACGILADFLEDEKLVSTVSGRMSSGEFDFSIDTAAGPRQVAVNNSQIEIDAAYEGVRCLSLFEAKRDLAEDFLIRQLYYPFRLWNSRVTKPVRPVFLIFTGGVFYLYEYRFEDPGNYNSLRLVKQRNYAIETRITRADLEDLIKTAQLVPEPAIPFPQANSMPRVINLLEKLNEDPMTREQITAMYAFASRQTNYYTDAGRYLGLVEKGRSEEGAPLFRLSPLGRQVMGLGYRERLLALTGQILRHRPFHEAVKLCLRSGRLPDNGAVVEIMKRSGLYGIGTDNTFSRRSSTVIKWIGWILGLIEDPDQLCLR